MLYLSKGVLCKNSVADNLRVARGNKIIELSESESKIWLLGRFQMEVTNEKEDFAIIKQLSDKGLMEYEDSHTNAAKYFILTRCICCPTITYRIQKPLFGQEKVIMKWLSNAGIRLSVAELIYLIEHKIKPENSLFYTENAQALVETIYTQNTIYDNILENQMLDADCREEVVRLLLHLLSKKRIVML